MNRTPRSILLLMALLSLLAAARPAWSSGFALPDQAASAMGMAGAFTALANDPAAVWYNPAGITQLPGTQASAGIVAIYPSMKHTNLAGIEEAPDRKVHLPFMLYATGQLGNGLSFGFGINNPFGLSTKWSETSTTSAVATLSSIQTVNLNPNIAYKVSDTLSMAVGIDYMLVDATLENVVAGPNNLRIDGSGAAYGANASLLLRASDSVNVGVSYRRKMRADLNGDVAVTTLGLSTDGTTSILFPDLLSLGIVYRMTPALTGSLQADYTNWSTYDQTALTSGTFALMGLGSTVVIPHQWQDTVCYRLGFQYQASEQLRYRFGILYDQNPVRSEYYDTRLPDSDREGVTIGVGHDSGRMTIDASYMYLHFKPRDITLSYLDVTAPSVSGHYESLAHIASLSVAYRF